MRLDGCVWRHTCREKAVKPTPLTTSRSMTSPDTCKCWSKQHHFHVRRFPAKAAPTDKDSWSQLETRETRTDPVRLVRQDLRVFVSSTPPYIRELRKLLRTTFPGAQQHPNSGLLHADCHLSGCGGQSWEQERLDEVVDSGHGLQNVWFWVLELRLRELAPGVELCGDSGRHLVLKST